MCNSMKNDQWNKFFEVCSSVLGKGSDRAFDSESWCSWTTYSRLSEDAGYWVSGIPNKDEITANGVKDGGTWGQPFGFEEIAHIIIPRRFYWESGDGPEFKHGYKQQDIVSLASALSDQSIPHRLTELVLEIKCY